MGTPTFLAQGGDASYLVRRALAFDANNIYWSDGEIKMVRLGGGRTETVGAMLTALVRPRGFDGPNIYWFANCGGTNDAWLLTAPVIVGYPAKMVATGIGKDWSRPSPAPKTPAVWS